MAELLIENQNLVYDSDSSFIGYNITRTTDTDLIFRNNYLSSVNNSGYMLIAGDENVSAYNNNLDGSIIEHNYFDWNGTLAIGIITHGVFTGYNINNIIRYNYLDNVPMGIIRKSNGMTDTSGVIAYNIIKNGSPGVVCKGMNGVRIYNNTFYSNHSSAVCNRAMIDIYYNDSIGVSATSQNCKVKNNIFYSVESDIKFISIDSYSSTGFECDYNIYWCENSVNNEPIFTYHGSTYTWTQWRALGYDAHSVIVDPHFHTTIDFIPERRLNYGINLALGSLVSHGIDFETTWSTSSSDGVYATQIQDSNWQVGAVTLRTGNNIGGDWYLAPWGSDTLGDGSFNNPYFTLTKLWTVISAGETCYMRGGNYEYTSSQILTGKSGTSDNYINIFAYPDEIPNITKGIGYISPGSWPHGLIRLTGSYIHFKGLEVSYFTQESSGGIWNGIVGYLCHNSIFEKLNCHHNGNGMGLISSGDNQVIDSDFHHNYDPYDTAHPYPDPLYDPYGDADGLGIQDDGYGTETIVKGCRFWCNSDDGIDLWYSSKKVTIKNCWSFWNGYSDNGITPYNDPLTEGYDGDGNGFKLGPCVAPPYTGHELEHLRTVQNCVAAYNRAGGFNMNVTYCIIKLYNNIAFSNTLAGYHLFDWGTAINEVKNNISLNDGALSYFKSLDILDHNSFLYTGAINTSYSISTADFVSSSVIGIDSERQYDGSLPILNFLHPIVGSDIIGTGTAIDGLDTDCDGKEWNTTPSLGAFEYQEALTGYYVAPFGSDITGTGTFANPYKTLYKAWTTHTAAGITIYLRGGIYKLDAYLNLGTYSGIAGNTRKVFNYPNEQPTFIPSQAWLDSTTQDKAIYVRADYVHIKGLEITGFVQRKYSSYYDGSGWQGTSSFVLYDSDHCIIERLNCHHGGFGITLNGATKGTDNLILNCDTHHNYDPYTIGYEYGGVDGITIRVDLTPGTTNTIRGCRMWDNSDDGFDGWGNEGLLVWDSCWAWHNGYREDGITPGGDGNGIKFGPIRTEWASDQHEYNQHLRTMQNCVAYNNRSVGFHENATCCIRWIYNNIAYRNGIGGFVFNNNYIINPIDIVRNNIAYMNGAAGATQEGYFNTSSVVDHNTFLYNSSYNTFYSVSDEDFVSLDDFYLESPRQANGYLPKIDFLHLAEGSDLIWSGINVGLTYDADGNLWNTVPSLGAFEYDIEEDFNTELSCAVFYNVGIL